MNKAQRIVIWVVASALAVVSLWHGLADSWDGYWGRYWHRDSLLWMVAIPIILLGAAFFASFIKGKQGLDKK
jgi:hypothetical protein